MQGTLQKSRVPFGFVVYYLTDICYNKNNSLIMPTCGEGKTVSVKKKIRIIAVTILLILVTVWLVWENQTLVRTDYQVASRNLPQAFDGYRIVQISDLHNTRFGKGNARLLELISQAQPDMIAITGDLIDSRRTNVAAALEFAKAAAEIAPCYYVTGNHEIRDEDTKALLAGLERAGVMVLSGQILRIEEENQWIYLAGIDDTSLVSKKPESESDVAAQMLDPLQTSHYSILLSHRPEPFPVYGEYQFDLTLTGHTHGGQIRLPWLGGIFASGEFFPEYDAGLFQQGDTAMVVSRGLGNSLFPVRINNLPEVVVVTLTR